MLQPDLGTTVALTIVFMAVLFFAGAPWWMLPALAVGGLAGFFSWRCPPTTGWPGCSRSSTRRRTRTARATSCCRACTGWATAAVRRRARPVPGEVELPAQRRLRLHLRDHRRGTGPHRRGLGAALFALLAYTGLRIARAQRRPVLRIVVARRRRGWSARPPSTSATSWVCCRSPASAADDLLRRNLAGDHHGGLRAAGQRGPPRARGRRGPGPREPRHPATPACPAVLLASRRRSPDRAPGARQAPWREGPVTLSVVVAGGGSARAHRARARVRRRRPQAAARRRDHRARHRARPGDAAGPRPRATRWS